MTVAPLVYFVFPTKLLWLSVILFITFTINFRQNWENFHKLCVTGQNQNSVTWTLGISRIPVEISLYNKFKIEKVQLLSSLDNLPFSSGLKCFLQYFSDMWNKMTEKEEKRVDERRYAILTKETIRLIAEAAGHSDITDEAAALLGEDASYRLREATHVIFLAHLSRRLEWAIVIAHRPSSVRPSSVRRRPSSSVNFHIFDFFSRTARWILMKLGRDEVLMVHYKCCCFSARSPQGQIQGRGQNRSRGVPFFKKLLLQTGRLQRQTECIAMI